ncbi:autophagy protein atg9 [Borealophlyctis nickersoniae]|nr:autophagy protein atg9 [Borealophlyctis nickersoniae]
MSRGEAGARESAYQLWADVTNLDEFLVRSAMQTLEWRDVVSRLTRVNGTNGRPGFERLEAHGIANRILRKDNYMIAIFNKDILDLTIPFLGKRQMLTKIMEWNLSFCILSYVFNEKGLIRKRFLNDVNRTRLINGLKKRLMVMAVLNLVCAPFLLILLILHFFFRYAEEFHKNPSSLGSRQYTPFAWWKFREFNELPHIFQRRLNRSYPKAIEYMAQFPAEKLIILARFVAFIAGSFAAVLVILTMVEEELLHGFDITPGRSAFFYIGIFGTVMAVSRGMVPDDNEVFEPERCMREVAEETHYMPGEWRGKLHTDEVRVQFSQLFDYKVVLFLYEILSVVSAPFILYWSLPPCAENIVDFFREFTVHVDSLGYVCSFAVFDFRKHGNAKVGGEENGEPLFALRVADRPSVIALILHSALQYGAPSEAPNEHFVSKGGKMEQSFLNFKVNNPDWDPGMEGSQYLNTVIARRNEFVARAQHGDPSASSIMVNSFLRPRGQVRLSMVTLLIAVPSSSHRYSTAKREI